MTVDHAFRSGEHKLDEGSARVGREQRPAPRWRWLEPGARVTPLGRRRGGTVVKVLAREMDGVTTHVLVCWDRDPTWGECWPTDFLTEVL